MVLTCTTDSRWTHRDSTLHVSTILIHPHTCHLSAHWGTKCERSIGAIQVICVGVYENGTYMYNRQQMDTHGLHHTCKYHSHTPPHMSPEYPLQISHTLCSPTGETVPVKAIHRQPHNSKLLEESEDNIQLATP